MLSKLEEMKRYGAYAIQLWFGEDVGCDDLGVPIGERKLVVVWRPVGHLGEIQAMFKGNVNSFLTFSPESTPQIISNPPQKEEYEKDGFYLWGTDRSIESLAPAPEGE